MNKNTIIKNAPVQILKAADLFFVTKHFGSSNAAGSLGTYSSFREAVEKQLENPELAPLIRKALVEIHHEASMSNWDFEEVSKIF